MNYVDCVAVALGRCEKKKTNSTSPLAHDTSASPLLGLRGQETLALRMRNDYDKEIITNK
jgi:hypothetical protein